MRLWILLLGLVSGGVGAQQGELPETARDAQAAPDFRLDPNAPDDRPLHYYRIAPDTYFLFGTIAQLNETNRGWMGNAGFVVTDDGVLAIDALGTPKLGRRFLATIRSVTDQPVRYLVLTHNHPDHAYGAVAFEEAGAQVISHAGVSGYIGSETMQASVAYRKDILADDMSGFRAVQPDLPVDDPRYSKRRLRFGGKTFDIYNTGRHHSHGDLVVHQVEENILWISDLAFNGRTTFMGDGDSKQILAGIEWLRQQFPDAELIVPGHGSPQTAPFPMLERTYQYVDKLRQAMRAAVDEGLGMLEAIDRADFPEWENTPLYEENHRRNAHFVYREMEEAFFFDE